MVLCRTDAARIVTLGACLFAVSVGCYEMDDRVAWHWEGVYHIVASQGRTLGPWPWFMYTKVVIEGRHTELSSFWEADQYRPGLVIVWQRLALMLLASLALSLEVYTVYLAVAWCVKSVPRSTCPTPLVLCSLFGMAAGVACNAFSTIRAPWQGEFAWITIGVLFLLLPALIALITWAYGTYLMVVAGCVLAGPWAKWGDRMADLFLGERTLPREIEWGQDLFGPLVVGCVVAAIACAFTVVARIGVRFRSRREEADIVGP